MRQSTAVKDEEVRNAQNEVSKGGSGNRGNSGPALICVYVMSKGFKAGNTAKITINDVEVQIDKNKNRSLRGLHIVFINPSTGKILLAKIFDTYIFSFEFDKFVSQKIPDGTIVAVACKDDCARNLSRKGRQWFADMGSQEIFKLGYR